MYVNFYRYQYIKGGEFIAGIQQLCSLCWTLQNVQRTLMNIANRVTGTVELTEICLGCLCEATSRCNATIGCNEEDCGMFRITRPYWMDAERPVLSLDNPDSEGGKLFRVDKCFCSCGLIYFVFDRLKQFFSDTQNIIIKIQ